MFEVERPRLEKAALLALRRAAVLVEEAECALLRLVALPGKILERLAASGHLAAADNPAVLVLNKVLLLETAGGVLRRTVPDLRFRANCGDFGHLIQWNAILLSAGGPC